MAVQQELPGGVDAVQRLATQRSLERAKRIKFRLDNQTLRNQQMVFQKSFRIMERLGIKRVEDRGRDKERRRRRSGPETRRKRRRSLL